MPKLQVLLLQVLVDAMNWGNQVWYFLAHRNVFFEYICLSLLKYIRQLGTYARHSLSHWGRVTHICVSDLTSIGLDNGLSPGRRQAIIRTNAGILLIRPLGRNFSEFLVAILIFSFKKMRLKVSSAKKTAILSRPQSVKKLPQTHEAWLQVFTQINSEIDLVLP